MGKVKSLLAHLTIFIFTVIFSARVAIILFKLDKLFRLSLFLVIWYTMIIYIIAGYKSKKNAYGALTALYSLNLLNLILVPSFIVLRPYSYLSAILFTLVGIIGSAMYAYRKKVVRHINFPIDLTETIEIVEQPTIIEAEIVEKIEPVKAVKKVVKSKKIIKPVKAIKTKTVKKSFKIKKTFAPARYMASKSGEKFHSPKCTWAKKINKRNLVWLKDKSEAKAKGYKKCGLCIK